MMKRQKCEPVRLFIDATQIRHEFDGAIDMLRAPPPPAKYNIGEHFKLNQAYDQKDLQASIANALSFAMAPTTAPWSRLFIYYIGKQTLHETIRELKLYGCPLESNWPYIQQNFSEKPPLECFHTLKITTPQFTHIPQTLYTMMKYLAHNYMITLGFLVFRPFLDVDSSGQLPTPLPGECPIGGHCAVIIGYTATQFIVRNSFGPDWGDNGNFHVDHSYFLNPYLTTDLWVTQ
jgi:hypothetical protein